MASVIAGPGVAGKNCPFCQTPIKPSTPAHVCDACGIPHHSECWQHNGGCTTFGCTGVGVPRPHNQNVMPPPGGYDYSPPPAAPPQYAQPQQGFGQSYYPAYTNPYQQVDVPPAIAGRLNWGAFLLPFFWSIAHNVWVGLIVLIPYVGWIMAFVLLFKGNEMAWKSRRFNSVEHFLEVQSIWTKWAVGLIVGGIALCFLIGMLAAIGSMGASGSGY